MGSSADHHALVDREEDLLVPPSGMFMTIHHAPEGGMSNGGGAAVLVPPLFEEMPRTRKVMVNLARELAAAGLTAIRFDYRGTGLSRGRFEEVTLTSMREDLAAVLRFCRSRGARSVSLLGFRLGGYLAAEHRDDEGVPLIVLWEPVLDLGEFMNQMLRLEVANQMITGSSVRFDRQVLISKFGSGKKVLVDGYWVNPGLYRELVGTPGLSLTGLSGARQKLRLFFWRTKKFHSEALALGFATELLPNVRFSWSDIRFLQPRHLELFARTILALTLGGPASGAAL